MLWHRATVIASLLSSLEAQPTLALFLILGIGYLIGNIKLFGFQVGATTGVLAVGLLFGAQQLETPPQTQMIGFILFIYCVGLQAGPQFFGAFREEGGKFLLLALFVAATAVTATALLSRTFGFEAGYSAGVLAGALTSTPALVAAQDAITSGMADLPADLSNEVALDNLTVSYAITYVVGLVGIVFLIEALPRLLRIDLREEAAKLARLRDFGAARDVDRARWRPEALPIVRVYRVEEDALIERTISQAEFFERSGCLVARLRREGALLEVGADLALESGDLVAVFGVRERHGRARALLGPEVVDLELLELRSETRSILVTRRDAIGRTAQELGITETNGLFLTEIVRASTDVPASLDLKLQQGDVLVVTGSGLQLERLTRQIGHAERPIHETDLVTFAFGIAAGLAIGGVAVRVGNLSLGLGISGGLLFSGLTVGFLRTKYPDIGRVPLAARWVFMELGLMFFMAGIGIRAGDGILDALRSAGPALVLAGAVVTTLPLLLGFAFGRYALRLHPVILMGALTGAATSTPALRVVTQQAGSSLPSVGYAGTYAFANVILAVAGGLLVRL
jgi:putative transport protein